MGRASCGHENPAGARFCATCGVELGAACPACSTISLARAAFCSSCGESLATAATTATTATAERLEPLDPSAIDAPSVPSAASLRSIGGGEGERRRLTVVFCDLEGSTALASGLDAEEFGEVVDAYYRVCGDAIRQHGGTVASYLGDGLLALFGYPEATETAAEDAVAAGLAVQDAIAELNRSGGAVGMQISARIGIHGGLVVVTDVGSDDRREMHVLGDAVNIAARLQTLAGSGGVLMTSSIAERVAHRFVLEPLGPRVLKGVPGEVDVLRAVAPASAATRAPRAPTGLFVGRSSELALLVDRWQSARRGTGHVVVVSGDAGIGKTALLQQLRDVVAPDGAWNEAAASRLDAVRPFAVVRAQIESSFGWSPAVGPEERLTDLEASLLLVDDDVSERATLIGSMLGLPVDGRHAPLLVSPVEARRRLIAVLVEWVRALALQQPLALVVEDAQWADPSSLEALGMLAGQVSRVPLLVVITARPDFDVPWRAGSHDLRLNLTRLGAGDIEAIVRHQLDRSGKIDPQRGTDTLVDLLVARSDGVPLFAEALADAVDDPRASPAEVPETLYDSLMARLDRLGPGKAIAQAASVIGREFPFDLLLEVSGAQPDELAAALDDLTRAEIIEVRGAPPLASYVFHHALVQQAAYDSMLRRRRAARHLDVATALVRRRATGEPVAPEVLAHHWSGAGQIDEAGEAWREAAKAAVARSAFAEAETHYLRAIELLDELPADDARTERELVLQLGLTDARQLARGFAAAETQEAAARARALSERITDPELRLRTLHSLWGTALSSGEIQSGAILADELLRVASDSGNDEMIRRAHIAQAGVLYNLGRYEESCDHVRLADTTPTGVHDRVLPASGHVQSALYGGASAALLGRCDEARRMLTLMRDAAERPDADALGQLLFPVSASVVNLWLRDYASVLELTARLEHVGQQYGVPIFIGWARLYSGWAQAMTGDAPGGIARLSDGLAIHVNLGQRLGLNHSLSLLAEAQAAGGRYDAAVATINDALALADGSVQPQHTTELRRLRGRVAAQVGADDEAEALLRAALDEAASGGAVLMEVRIATELLPVLARTGRADEGRRLLTEALTRMQGDAHDRHLAAQALAKLEQTRAGS